MFNLSLLKTKKEEKNEHKANELKEESKEIKNEDEGNILKKNNTLSLFRTSTTFGNLFRSMDKKKEEEKKLENYKEIFTYLGRKNVLNAASIDINVYDLEKRTIVHRACYQLKYDILKELNNVLNENYVNQLDIYGNSPLILACKLPNKDNSGIRCQIIKLLISKRANIHILEPVNGWSALHWACFNGDLETVKLLIENAAIFYLPCIEGDFPIDLAGKKKHKEIVSYLISESDKFLETIGDFCELDPEICKIKQIKKAGNYGGNLLDRLQNIVDDRANDEDDEYKKVTVDLNVIPPFTQSVFLRCYISHCLYWGCYYKIEDQLIQKYIEKYKACSIQELFCLNHETPLHAACSSGNYPAFKLLFDQYRELVKRYENNKTNELFRKLIQNTKGIKIIRQDELNDKISQMKKGPYVSNLSSNFKKYLVNYAKYFIFPKDIRPVLPILQMVDSFGNIPLNSAAKYSQDNFIEDIKKNNLITNFDEMLSASNKYGISGYYFLKNDELQNEFLTMANKRLYPIPLVVIELNKSEKTRASINLMIKILIAENLKVSLMEHHNPLKLYLLINIEDKEFCEIAEREEMEFKLLDKHLKMPFVNTNEFKVTIEPFLSRHYQQAISAIISNMLDVEMLKSQSVISNIFYTHKPNVTQKILDSIIKKGVPNPLAFFFDYFFEGKDIIFKEIDLLWRYFGEVAAMYYAFYGYWTIYYVFLAVVGLVYVGLYTGRIFKTEDIFTIYFLIFTVWNFIFLFRWRRKSEEIEHNWGMKMSSMKREIREKFRGDEFYRQIDENLEKHVPEYSSVKVFLCSLPLILILLAGDIVVFYYTTEWEEKEKDNENFIAQYLPSIVRSLALNAISFIYDWVANYFADKENHKFENEYNNILIIKIFVFRLIADFTSVIYSALVQKNIENLKIQLYTNLIVKYLCELGMKFIIPFLFRSFFSRRYFNYVKTQTKDYSDLIDNNGNNENNAQKTLNDQVNLNDENMQLRHSIEQKQNSKLNDGDINLRNIEMIIQHENTFRIVPSISGKINKDQSQFNFNPDFIEVTNILNEKGNLIYNYADLVIIHAICSMFAILIPFAPVIVLIFSIITQNAKLYVDLFFYKRAPAKKCQGIGIWYEILEIVSVLSIILNSFLYYFYGKNFFIKEGITEKREFSLGLNEKSLFYSIIMEHGLILLQFILKFAIPAVPYWVIKERENLLVYYQKAIAEKEKIKSDQLRENLKKFEQSCKEKISKLIEDNEEKERQIQQYKNSLNTYKEEINKKDQELNEGQEKFLNIMGKVSQMYQSSNDIKFPRLRRIEESQQGKIISLEENSSESLIEESEDDYLLDFSTVKKQIDIKFDLPLQKIIKELIANQKFPSTIDSEIKIQNIRKVYFFNLIKSTFDKIEEEISLNKFKKYMKNIDHPIVMCDFCLDKRANFICEDCQQLFCSQCKKVHLSNSLWSNHRINSYNVPFLQNDIANFRSNEEEEFQFLYIKMENFTFPKEVGKNLGYENLEKIFDFLYQEYFTKNGINSDNLIYLKNKIQLQIEFFTLLTETPNQVSQKEISHIIKLSYFNSEELFFINRVCFKVFKFYGAKTTLQKIHKMLKKLQSGPYEEKLLIVLNILDIYDNQLILRNEFEKFLLFITLQSFHQEYNIENILKNIFKDENTITLQEIYNILLKDNELSQMMKYLLQIQQ